MPWHRNLTRAICLSGLLLGLGVTPARALLIVPTFDNSITGAGNAANVVGAVNQAISTIDGLYSDPGTVGIYFKQASSSTFLGSTSTVFYYDSYANYTSALQNDLALNPSNTVLATALANLASGNDAGGAVPVVATSALWRAALGISGATPCFSAAGAFLSGCNGVNDAVITLGNNLNYAGQTGSSNSQGVSVIEHEINEALGGGGTGTTLGTGLESLFYGVTDLYRYLSNSATCAGITSAPSFTTASSTVACYSINGGASALVQMNQSGTGDYGDFTGTQDIQNYFYAGTTAVYSTTSPEYTMMLSIGYDPIPEPASLVLLATSLAGLATACRRLRASVS